MSEEAKTAKSDGAEAAPASSGGGKIGTILSIMNLLLTLGIGAVVFLQFQKDKHRETVSDIQPNAEPPAAEAGHGEAAHGEHGAEAAKPSDNLITLDQFTVNLSTSPGTPPRFARVTVAIEVSSGEAGKELNAKMAPVRNAILDLFNSKRPADLQTGEGRNFLKEEIRNALNGMLISGKVKAVFFSAFQVST